MSIPCSRPDAAAPKPPLSRKALVTAVVAWSVVVLLGCAAMIGYELVPGPMHAPQGPITDGLVLDAHRPTLVMIVHPKCPCSKASLAELSTLLEEHQGAVTAHIVIFLPPGAEADWTSSPVARQAAEVRGADVQLDLGGVLSARLGAETSGTVVLLSPDGSTLFQGGITPARGHGGFSQGRQSILEVLAMGHTATTTAPVFGCDFGTQCSEHDDQ